MIKQNLLKNKVSMALCVSLIFFTLFSFATAADNFVESKATASPFACDDCVKSKAAFFTSSSGLSSGSCGYSSEALKFHGGHVAAVVPSLYNCGACFQIRCKNKDLCSKAGTKVVVTDAHTDKSNTTDFVLSSRAFRAMALPGKDRQLLKLGLANVDYKRIPCVYKGQNLAIRVEEFSKYPNYLAITLLYQGGQTEILLGEVGIVSETYPPNWKPLRHKYGAVWETSEAPAGPIGAPGAAGPWPLQFRFAIKSGYDAQYFYTEQVLPANWMTGVIYNSTVQIDNVAAHGCNPCGEWK